MIPLNCHNPMPNKGTSMDESHVAVLASLSLTDAVGGRTGNM